MPEQGRIFETLLSDLVGTNYDSLLHTLRLRLDGWKIHYVLDADLVGNYCFPRGINSDDIRKAKFRVLRDEYISDEQAALHNLFKTSEHLPQGLILDEYVMELRGMTKAAQYAALNNIKHIKDFVDHWLNRGENVNSNFSFDELTDDIRNYYSERLGEVLFGIAGLNKFSGLLGQGRIIFENSELLDDSFIKLFDNETGDKKEIDKIIKLFIKKATVTNLPSRTRDARAIQRIIAINRELLSHSKINKDKHLLLFVIDAPSIMQEVFDDMRKFHLLEFPSIDGHMFPLYTTTQEVFAHLICRATDSDGNEDIEKTISELENLKHTTGNIQHKIAATKEAIPDHPNEDLLNGKYEALFINYKSIRNDFENTGLFKNLSDIQDEITTLLKDRKTTNLLEYFKKVNTKHSKLLEEFSDRDNLLNELVSEIEFKATFITNIEEIKYNKTPFVWSKGKDPVEGSYQILPIFLQLENYTGYAAEITKVIHMVLGNEKSNDIETYNALKDMMTQLSKVKSRSSYDITEKLLKALIFLILPESTADSNKRNKRTKDQWVYEWINKLEQDHELLNYEADFIYLKCWVLRRIEKYSESIRIAKNGIKKFREDPRFFHGLALAKYCQTSIAENADIIDYDEIISNLNAAEYLYPKFLNAHYSTHDSALFIKKLVACHNNNICFFQTMKASLLFDTNYELALQNLENARKKLDLLKESKKFIVELPEYYDTEAFLEYTESFFDEFSSSFKINRALEAIDKAINLGFNSELIIKYNRRREDILDRRRLLNGVE